MEPRKTIVGELALNQDNEVLVVFENDGDADFTINRIVSQKLDTVYFTAEKSGGITVAPGKKVTVKLVVKPTTPGRFLDRIAIYSDARNDIGKGYTGLLSGEVE